MNTAFPGLLGRRIRLEHDGPSAWRGCVVGWDEGCLVIETPGGQLEQLGWRGVVIEDREAALTAAWRPEMADDL